MPMQNAPATTQNAPPEPGAFRLIATLGIAGLLSGVILAGVYRLTQPRIERNRAEALKAAIYRVLIGARTHQDFVLRQGKLEPWKDEPGQGDRALPRVYAGYDEKGKLVGYAIPAAGPGFQDTISLLYGFAPGRQLVVGLEVLESKETPGLGDKIIKDQEFLENFKALMVEPEIRIVKKGGKTRDNQVEGITGATISSKAVVKIINAGNRRWLAILKERR